MFVVRVDSGTVGVGTALRGFPFVMLIVGALQGCWCTELTGAVEAE